MVGMDSMNGSRILIADDAEEDRRFLARRLQRIGYTDERTPSEARTKVAATMAETLDTTARIAHEIDLGSMTVGERNGSHRAFETSPRNQADGELARREVEA